LSVSRRVRYRWSCANCGAQQEALVWRILYADERGSLADEPEAGLASVSCVSCGALAEIDEPLLVIRPGSALPLLLGLAMSELAAPQLRIRELGAAPILGCFHRLGVLARCLARRHPDGSVQPDRLAVEVWVLDDAHGEVSVVVRGSQPICQLARSRAATSVMPCTPAFDAV
jgi:hypothetical protein